MPIDLSALPQEPSPLDKIEDLAKAGYTKAKSALLTPFAHYLPNQTKSSILSGAGQVDAAQAKQNLANQADIGTPMGSSEEAPPIPITTLAHAIGGISPAHVANAVAAAGTGSAVPALRYGAMGANALLGAQGVDQA